MVQRQSQQPTPRPKTLREFFFCLFSRVQEIPKIMRALPTQHKLNEKELADLQVSCIALFGIVTPNHFFVWSRAYSKDVFQEEILPHLWAAYMPWTATACTHNASKPGATVLSGSRWLSSVAGRENTNITATLKRARAKQQSGNAEVWQF